MTFAIRATAFVCLSLSALAPAQAAVPKVSGTYATMSWHTCQTVVVTPKSVVSKVGNPITVQGIGGFTLQTGTFATPGGGSSSAVTNVQPTSTVSFVTVVNHSNFQAVTSVENNLNAGTPTGASGMVSMSVGTVTFPATAASSGTATASSNETLGHSIRFPGDNGAISHHVNGAQQAAFSLTQTSATIGGKTYDMSFGNVQAGVARTINLIRQPGANEYCIDGMTLTKQ
ncbi:MAG: hypothetical protein WBD48_07250 [Pseudolabrys sp.]